MENKNILKEESIKEIEEKMGRGIFGIRMKTQRNIFNFLGYLFMVFGIYLFLVASKILPFTSRFNFFQDIRIQFITSLVLIILGFILNEKTRNLFQ